MIPYGKHHINQQDIDTLVDVLKYQFLTQGEQIPAFESALGGYTGAKFASAVHSGTAALHVACLALGVGEGDLVWTVPNSFVASANCALYCGAKVDFVDIDPETRNISVLCLEDKISDAVKQNNLPKALIVVHFAGESCDMERIHKLCSFHNIKIIEDAAHALGGKYRDKKVGCCEHSDLTVMSFHPVKSITTAEGGAILTNQSDLYQRCQLYSKHGVTRDESIMESLPDGAWDYHQVVLGYNYRMSDLHAALGISQLKRLDEFVDARKQIAKRYNDELSDLPLSLPVYSESSAWHIYTIEVEEHDRKLVFDALRQRGIGVNVHYIPIHLQPFYQNLGFHKGDFPNSEAYYEKAITIPLFPRLTADEQSTVINSLREILR
jgi:UDP-4-amino-4,6-dideoxy-N-acetyl-beta-L-altrosamine transaminase